MPLTCTPSPRGFLLPGILFLIYDSTSYFIFRLMLAHRDTVNDRGRAEESAKQVRTALEATPVPSRTGRRMNWPMRRRRCVVTARIVAGPTRRAPTHQIVYVFATEPTDTSSTIDGMLSVDGMARRTPRAVVRLFFLCVR